MAESQWSATATVMAAAAGAVILTIAAGAGGHAAGRQLLIPLLTCVLARRAAALAAAGAGGGDRHGRDGPAHQPRLVTNRPPPRVSLYVAVLRLPRPKSIALAVAVAASLGETVLYSAVAVGTAQAAAEATAIFVPLAGAWCIADSVAARRRYQASLSAQAEREQTADIREERVRIAREMHDVVAHALAVITVQAGVGRCLAAKRPEEASSALGSIETIGRTAQDELRVVLGLLRDGEAGTAPLAPAPRLIDVKDLADTVRASGVPVELRMAGTDRPLSPSLELSIYRVMQEALTNVVKHAPECPGGGRADRRGREGPPRCPRRRRARGAARRRGPVWARATGSSGCGSGSARSAGGWWPGRSPAADSR